MPTLQPFLDSTTTFEEAHYVIFGAPFDLTSSYRSGSRFAPNALRQASQYMETHSFRTGLDLSNISFSDIGDLRGLDSLDRSIDIISEVERGIYNFGKRPVMLGGEHSVAFGALKALKPDLVFYFDAHMDLRDSLLDLRLSHGTFMRRAMEELDFKLFILGCRAVSKDELEFVEENDDRVKLCTAAELLTGERKMIVKSLEGWLDGVSSTYISIDMDVIDPSQAPAVGNPSPEGINVTTLLDLITVCTDGRTRGFDLTEVSPLYDSGLTVTQAAYVILETIYALEAS